MQPFKIYVGFDPVERLSWYTAVSSIIEKSSVPVSFTPINIRHYTAFYNRPRDKKQSNEFSFSRFLVPFLSAYEGMALFMDCDMLLRVDISELIDIVDGSDKAVHLVKHDYEPRDDIKYLDTIQYSYPRKNWSSFVVWNCGHPKNSVLTPGFVEKATGLELHRFSWLSDDDIGELDIRWNWLVGEYLDPPKDVKNVHWTVGGPYFKEYSNVDFAEEWLNEKFNINYVAQRS